MNIILDGYFDQNFGDDMMQLMVVNGLKQHDFYVWHQQREMLAHLEGVENVHITNEFPAIDAYVNVIGTGFQFNGKRAAVEKILNISKQKEYPKSAVIGCSIEPVNGWISNLLTKRELRRYGLISCRDNISFAYINRNCPRSEVKVHHDILFALCDIIPKTGEHCLGVSITRRVYGSDNYRYYQAIAQCCDDYIDKYQEKVLLFAFDSGLENDISAALSVQKMMLRPDMTEIIAYHSDPEDLISHFAKCSKIIGSRFHSVVLSLVLGIPIIAVYDTAKLKRLCENFEIPSFKRENVSARELTALVESIEKPAVLPAAVSDDACGHIRDLSTYLEHSNGR